MTDSKIPTDAAKPPSRQKLPMLLWVFLGVLLAVIAWQQLRINQLVVPAVIEGTSPAINSTTPVQIEPELSAITQPANNGRAPIVVGQNTTADARRLLEQRARHVRELNPEATGQRMFEELKFISGDDQNLLSKLTERLVIEGRARRQLEEQTAKGEINQEQLTVALQQLINESEVVAKALLNPAQFDRYREVRQSWKRGRAHPHANQGE